MPFDATLAIAKLDFQGFGYSDTPDTSALRGRYPELGFVFDLLEDKLQEAENAAIEYRDERREVERNYQQEVDALEERNNDLRIALAQIHELTLDAEIRQIVEDVL